MMNSEVLLKKVTPKNDIVFRKIFGSKGNEEILKDFLEGILDIKIDTVKLDIETEILPEFYLEKTSKLDVLAEMQDGTMVDIEIQTNTDGFSDKRELVYWSKLYLKTLTKGQSYRETKKTICIWILDGEVYDFKKYHSKWEIVETDIGKTMHFKDFEIHVIELQKFRKLDIMKPRKKEFWLWFIDHTKKELIDMACYSNEQVKEAKELYEKITADKTLMSLIFSMQIREMDEIARRMDAEERGVEAGRRKGMEEGMQKGMEEGMQKGMEEGMQKGIAEGMQEGQKIGQEKGERKAKSEIARKLLEKETDIESIVDITGLTKEEILKLKEI